jgi:hypothetical protein
MLRGCLHIHVPTLVEQRQQRDANTTKDRRTLVSCHTSIPPLSMNA